MTRTVDVKALVSHIVRGDGVDRCRICMGETSQGQVFLEDTVMLDGERPVTLAELLETLTGLEVEISTMLPVGVCGTCATQALAAEKFRDLCKNSEHQWTLYSNCLDNLGPIEDKAGLYIISNGLDDPILLPDRKKPSENKDDIIRRIKVMQRFKRSRTRMTLNENPLKNFPCPECNYIFNVRQRLNKHISFMQKKCCRHCDTIVPFRDLEAHYHGHELTVYHCKCCTEVFDRSEELTAHMRVHVGPNHVCEECNNSFMTAAALNRHIETHSPLSCPTCNKLFSTWNCFSKHKRICTGKVQQEEYKCPDCETIFVDLEELNRHTLENGYKVCCYCRTTVSAEDFEKHLKSHDVEILACPDCLEIFDDEDEYELHTKVHAKEIVKCKLCFSVSTSMLTLLTHMKYSHSMACITCNCLFTSRDCHAQHIQICPSRRIKQEQEFVGGYACPSCEQVFFAVSKLRTHLKESNLRICWVCRGVLPLQKLRQHMGKHKAAMYPCLHCEDVFLNEKKLKKHTDTRHNMNFAYKCVECHRSFDTQFGLNMHVPTHSKSLCPCGKRFETSVCFAYHRRRCADFRNAKATTYICDHCKAEFRKKPSLMGHITLKHMMPKRHICSTCGKGWDSYMHLLEHEETHNKIRDRYDCEICQMSMTSRRGYEKHMMKHSGNKFKCLHCDKAFPNAGQRTTHVMHKHPETTNIYPCTICKKKYTKSYNLDKHMRERHID